MVSTKSAHHKTKPASSALIGKCLVWHIDGYFSWSIYIQWRFNIEKVYRYIKGTTIWFPYKIYQGCGSSMMMHQHTNPLDFFLWGFLKDKVYKRESMSQTDLLNHISLSCKCVTPNVLKYQMNYYSRMLFCITPEESHFEQVLC